jgi:hypothetical protein
MTNLRRSGIVVASLALVAGSLTGCQTQLAGMTLPSGHYLEHRPQYFPTEPSFPLSRELATMQAQNQAAAAADSAAGARLPVVTAK